MHDEGPSDADLARFGDDAGGHCPECGATVYDDIEQCPACGMYITGAVSRPPRDRAAKRARMQIIAIITLIGFLLLAGIGGILSIF